VKDSPRVDGVVPGAGANAVKGTLQRSEKTQAHVQ